MVAGNFDSYLFSPELLDYINASGSTDIMTIGVKYIDKQLMIQQFLPKLSIQDVRVVDGVWEALVTFTHKGHSSDWIQVRKLIDNSFKEEHYGY